MIGLSGSGTQIFFLSRLCSRSSASRTRVTSSFNLTDMPGGLC